MEPAAVKAIVSLMPNTEKEPITKIILVPMLVVVALLIGGYLGFNYLNGVMTGKMKVSIIQSDPNATIIDSKDSTAHDNVNNNTILPSPVATEKQLNAGIPAALGIMVNPAAIDSPLKVDMPNFPNSPAAAPDSNRNPLENLPIKR